MHHPNYMPLDPEKLRMPLRKLRRSLKQLPSQPSPEEVHDLRTRSRRLEATLHALMLDQRGAGRRLLESIAPIRKRAGKVRDMDVLTGFAAGLAVQNEDECRVQLIQALGEKRLRYVRKLRDTAAANRGKTRRRLKRYAALIDRKMKPANSRTAKQTEWPADAMAIALQLSFELARWPTLKAGNLHPWRSSEGIALCVATG
jgi:CHAD domain-containing protein